MKAQSSLKKGMNVRYKAGGKVSRLEGMAGKIVTAKAAVAISAIL